MRNSFFLNLSLFSIISGTLSGCIASLLQTTDVSDVYGAWLRGFYQCEAMELWIKSIFSTVFYPLLIFILGFFIFGYICVLPIIFYHGYTFGFLVTCTVRCFGILSLPNIIVKIPTVFLIACILIKEATLTIKFSSSLLCEPSNENIRKRTSKYLITGMVCMFFSGIPLLYDVFLAPVLLNLWDSF